MRAKKVEGGATTHYLTLGHQVMYEKTGTNHTRHIFAGSQRIAEVRNGEVSYFHNDHLGSPRRVTDVHGDPAGSSIATTPFGTPHATSEITSYMFTGKDRDTTGLYYFAARYYAPAVGRFVTEDTWEGRLHQPASQNRYVYVENNPLRYVDPTGHMPELTPEGGGSGGFVEVVIWGLTRALEAVKKVVGEVRNFVHNTIIGKVAPAASKAAEPVGKGDAARIFWSGGAPAQEAAQSFAQKTGSYTIDMTQRGSALAKQTVDMAWDVARPLWVDASREFVQGAKGVVHVFQSAQGVGLNSIWATVEYPALLLNPDIGNIIYHVVMSDGRILIP